MARQTTIQNYNNMTGGIVSDGNDISTVKNAVKDANNYDFTLSGAFVRKGLDYEAGVTDVVTPPSITTTDLDLGDSIGDIDSFNGIDGLDITIRQLGATIYIYKRGITNVLADNLHSTLTLISSPAIDKQYIEIVKVAGEVILVGRDYWPYALRYDEGTDVFSVEVLQINPDIRDFDQLYTGYTSNEIYGGGVPVLTLTLTSVTGAFVADEEVIDSVNSRKFKVLSWDAGNSILYLDKQTYTTAIGDTVGKEFDCIPVTMGGTNYVGSVLTGTPSGAVGTVSVQTGGVNDSYMYNLFNQGWGYDNIYAYMQAYNVAPLLSQIWFQGRDTSGNFSPAELKKQYFGDTNGPTGRFRISAFTKGRVRSLITSPPSDHFGRLWLDNPILDSISPTNFFNSASSFGNRIAFSGAANKHTAGTVYISPIIGTFNTGLTVTGETSLNEIHQFYQKNDPTSEFDNALLVDDGVSITINGAGTISKMQEVSNSLLCFSSKGVWGISGSDIAAPFRTDDFAVAKIEFAPGTLSLKSVVEVDGRVYYWTDGGMWSLQLSETGTITASPISLNKVQNLYDTIPVEGKHNAKGYHDTSNNKIIWAYCSNSSPVSFKHRDSILILDLITGGFSKKTISTTYSGTARTSPIMAIQGFSQDKSFSDSEGKIPLKILVVDYASDPDLTYSPIFEFNSESFIDYRNYLVDHYSLAPTAGSEYTGYIEPWPDTLGDFTRKKQAVWVFTYMQKTETGFEDNGTGGLDPIGQSKLLMNARWDWNNTDAGNRFTNPREIYRHKRVYIPADVNDTYDTGETVIQTKNKVFGQGYAVGMYFQSVSGYNSVLLGFSIPYTVENTP